MRRTRLRVFAGSAAVALFGLILAVNLIGDESGVLLEITVDTVAAREFKAHAEHNIVTGNIVGMDISGGGDFGNRNSGVWVTEGGMENVIGPDNLITYPGTKTAKDTFLIICPEPAKHRFIEADLFCQFL